MTPIPYMERMCRSVLASPTLEQEVARVRVPDGIPGVGFRFTSYARPWKVTINGIVPPPGVTVTYNTAVTPITPLQARIEWGADQVTHSVVVDVGKGSSHVVHGAFVRVTILPLPALAAIGTSTNQMFVGASITPASDTSGGNYGPTFSRIGPVLNTAGTAFETFRIPPRARRVRILSATLPGGAASGLQIVQSEDPALARIRAITAATRCVYDTNGSIESPVAFVSGAGDQWIHLYPDADYLTTIALTSFGAWDGRLFTQFQLDLG